MLSRVPRALTAACVRQPWTVLVTVVLLSVLAGVYTARNIGMDTATADLFPDDLPWRQLAADFDAAFPQNDDLLVVVIDAATPELAEAAAVTLAARLRDEPLIRSLRLPEHGEFFRRHGLLYLDETELRRLSARIVETQPLLGTLAGDPTLRGLFRTLAEAAEAAARGEFDWQRLAAPLDAVASTLEATLAGQPQPLSWRELLSGEATDPEQRRRFLLLQPVLDYGSLMPGAEASAVVRAAARELALDAGNHARVRLTGSVALADEEFATVAEGTGIAAGLSLVLVTVLLLLAVRSPRLVVAIVLTLLAGMFATFAFATAAVGSLNVISIAFVVLFVGLAVDFGIQFCVRLRGEHGSSADTQAALLATAAAVGPSLALAAVATAAGFLSLTPTDYAGVAELGLIAGAGLGIAWLANLTLLPALVCVLGMPAAAGLTSSPRGARLDPWLQRHRRAVLLVSAAVALAGLLALPRLSFDFDPLALKDQSSESVATLQDLAGSPNATPFTIDVLADSLAEAETLAARLRQLPEVRHAVTAASFVPQAQTSKLALIDELALLLGPPPVLAGPPAPGPREQVLAAARDAVQALAAAPPGTSAANSATRLAPLLRQLPETWQEHAQLLAEQLLGTLPRVIEDLDLALRAEPVRLADLPEPLRRDWLTPDGRARIEVFPAGDVRDNTVMRRFARAVLEVTPRATGAPVTVLASAELVTGAFVEAGWTALVVVTLLLVLVLRRLREVVLVLSPLLLAGLATALLCVALPLPLNFANIIALPLLMGIGVSFAVYLVIDRRRGVRQPLASPTARAVLFSALTTAAAFGSLALSEHPGTASMGALLALSLALTLAATMIFLPALMGPPRDE